MCSVWFVPLAALALATPALAKDKDAKTAPPTESAASQAAVNPAPLAAEKKVCRVRSETGSRLPGQKICLTKTEWAEARRLTQQQTDAYSDGLGRTRSNHIED